MENQEFQNLDDVIRKMRQDEIEDAPLITPVNYAKLRGMQPQLVYYRIRTGKLKTKTCNCGRKCIDIKEADVAFGLIDKEEKDE